MLPTPDIPGHVYRLLPSRGLIGDGAGRKSRSRSAREVETETCAAHGCWLAGGSCAGTAAFGSWEVLPKKPWKPLLVMELV